MISRSIVAFAFSLVSFSAFAQEAPDPSIINQDEQALIAAVRHVDMDMADLYRQLDALRKENASLKAAQTKAPAGAHPN